MLPYLQGSEMIMRLSIAATIWVANLLLPAAAVADVYRGELLYENNCQACHDCALHARQPRKARSARQLQHLIGLWQTELKLDWSAGDIADVQDYLDRRYYHFSYPVTPSTP
jgi:CxxC motif-containing protein (DUF1111 family)